MTETSELTWIGPVLTKVLGADSPIAQTVQAGKIPAVHVLVSELLANQGHKHPDREILTIAAVYLVLGDLLLKVDPKTSGPSKKARHSKQWKAWGSRHGDTNRIWAWGWLDMWGQWQRT